MLRLEDIRQYIVDLGISGDGNVYIGKLDNKKHKSVGVYERKMDGQPYIAAGGLSCTLYGIKPLSLLIHWTRSKTETEEAAYALYNKLLGGTGLKMGDVFVDYVRLMVPEPQDVGTDENGVYEYVIWLDLIYERER